MSAPNSPISHSPSAPQVISAIGPVPSPFLPEYSLTRGWQESLANAVRDPAELCRLLQLPTTLLEQLDLKPDFPLLVPREFVARMKPGDPDDPLLRQVLPLAEERTTVAGFVVDAVGDQLAKKTTGLIQKYHGRVLILLASACAIHCRYCFRRAMPADEYPTEHDEWNDVIAQIASDESIEEVILSGGDPLTRTDFWLAKFIKRLEAIPHLRRLRIHTRLPIVLPSRVDGLLLKWLADSRFETVMVVHINHPHEIDAEVTRAMDLLRQQQVTLLNQAVLLRGVNDSATVQIELSRQLSAVGVLPYYLHLLDRVVGSHHFEADEQLGRSIIQDMRHQLPGYLVPRLVREIPGQPSKTVLE